MCAEKTSWNRHNITTKNLSELVILNRKGETTTRVMKYVLLDRFQPGADPTNSIKEKHLGQISDEGKIIEVVKEIIKENEKAVEDYKKGKETVREGSAREDVGWVR